MTMADVVKLCLIQFSWAYLCPNNFQFKKYLVREWESRMFGFGEYYFNKWWLLRNCILISSGEWRQIGGKIRVFPHRPSASNSSPEWWFQGQDRTALFPCDPRVNLFLAWNWLWAWRMFFSWNTLLRKQIFSIGAHRYTRPPLSLFQDSPLLWHHLRCGDHILGGSSRSIVRTT